MKRGGRIFNRGSAVTDVLPWIIISVIVLVLILIATGVIKTSGVSLIDKARSLLGGYGG